MKVTSLTYGSTHDYGINSKEQISVTVELSEIDTEQDALNYAKEFVLSNSVSLDEHNKLEARIFSLTEELRQLSLKLEEAEKRLINIRSTADEISKLS